MPNLPHHLLTAIEAESEFGEKYFYRQRIYRFAESGKITAFKLRGQTCFLGSQILKAAFKELELKVASKFPKVDVNSIRIFYDNSSGKRLVVDGLFGKGVSANTQTETEEDLLLKIQHIVEFIGDDFEEHETKKEIRLETEETEYENSFEQASVDPEENSLAKVLPEEIAWVKVDTGLIKGVEVKSFILVSLNSIAQFIGIRPDHFTVWISKTTFSNFILSAHPKQLHDTQIKVPWKKGLVRGFNALLPFELLPEVIVAFRQSGRNVEYPEKTQLLYDLSKSTLEAVGLVITGDKEKASKELALVGKGLGLTVADQIIGIFKQYESRDFQIQTNREFNSKVKQIGADYAITSGILTFGITERTASQWKAFGASRKLPSSSRTSSREVMRTLSPADGVGMTFGERHFIKDPNTGEAIETGKKGKDFYQRLKDVGLLDD